MHSFNYLALSGLGELCWPSSRWSDCFVNVGSRNGDARRNIEGLNPVGSVAAAAALLLRDLELPDRLAALHAVCTVADRLPEPFSIAEVEEAGKLPDESDAASCIGMSNKS